MESERPPVAGTAAQDPQPPNLLDRLRAQIRAGHYSLSTEESYLHRVRAVIGFHRRRHPRAMGGADAGGRPHASAQRAACAGVHRQALSALLFVCRKVRGRELPWIQKIGRPRVPVVLSRHEVARLRCGTDMREMQRIGR